MSDFDKLFAEVIHQAKCVYIGKQEEKGESWQTCDIDYLEMKLKEEIKEFTDAIMPQSKFHEILDVINISLMLAQRWYDEYYEEWRRTPVR